MAARNSRPGIKTPPKFRRDERGRFAAKPSVPRDAEQAWFDYLSAKNPNFRPDLVGLTGEFNKHIASEEPEVLPNVVLWAIVAVVVVLAVAFGLS